MTAPNASKDLNERCFVTTHWSVVLAAREVEPSQSRKALEELCRAYWVPLYSYIRRRGYAHEDAKDLTQEFFLRLSAPDFLASVSSEKGKFRSFLLASLNHFLVNEWHRAHAQKRGGGALHISLDAEIGESCYVEHPASADAPELFFDKRYSSTCMELPIDFVKLADAYGAKGFSTSKPGDVEKIIKQGFKEKGPVIMEFKIAREEKVLPMVPAGAALNEMVLNA